MMIIQYFPGKIVYGLTGFLMLICQYFFKIILKLLLSAKNKSVNYFFVFYTIRISKIL